MTVYPQGYADPDHLLRHADRAMYEADLGRELAQGYAITRPMPSDQMHAWVSSRRSFPRWKDRSVTA